MSADVFALNTRDDTWGLVINEAMAMGLPIVTTRRCYAAMAMFSAKQRDRIVEVDDYKELNKNIFELLDSEELRREIGEDNIRVSRNYTIEAMGRIVYKQFSSIGERS